MHDPRSTARALSACVGTALLAWTFTTDADSSASSTVVAVPVLNWTSCGPEFRLTYLGFSYGSYLGNTYANRFPNKVRALVIDGVLDPRLWSSGLQIISDRIATARVFAEFLCLCDEAADACALSGPGGSAARFEALAAALRAAPVAFPDGSLYSYDLLITDAAFATYAPELWSLFAELFDAAAKAAQGGAEAVRRVFLMREALQQDLRARTPRRDQYENSFDAFYGNHCSDTQYPHSFAAYHGIGDFAEGGSIFGPYWWWQNAGCADWPVSPDRYTGPWTARTAAPVLVVGNFFDGVTDYNGAVASSKLLKNSRLLSYAGWGHTAFGRSECVTNHVIRYLLDGTLPQAGTICPANQNPFLESTLRSARAKALPMIGLPPLRPTQR